MTPRVNSIVQVMSKGTEQIVGRSAEYNYNNPDNTKAEIAATDFFDGVSKFPFDTNDIINVTASDGFAIMQLTTPTTAAIRLE